eukprot:COSAG02_NODE_588_length_19902_cov_115.928900_3_plen_72_part_00
MVPLSAELCRCAAVSSGLVVLLALVINPPRQSRPPSLHALEMLPSLRAQVTLYTMNRSMNGTVYTEYCTVV